MLKNYIYILFVLVIHGSLFAISCNNEDCAGTCYYYYYDLDNDDKLGRAYGYICASAGDEDDETVSYLSLIHISEPTRPY